MGKVRRLHNDYKPSHYQLEIIPDMAALTFRGTVTITLRKTSRPSQRFTFHQKELTIDHATITKLDKKATREIAVTRINNQDTLNEVRLHTSELLYSGEYRVTLDFHGTITKGMTGLYPCYFTVGGKEHMMLATQFESHYARELFPCIDEPAAKATFDLSVHASQDMTVLGNTPVVAEEPQASGLIKTTFTTTPKMSTYLLAFVIGELQSVRIATKRGTEVSVWATIAQPLAALEYALAVAKGAVEFFEDYFGIPYPLPKLDHVGLPDFTAGAMENWGLITYRERLLLAYPGEASQSIKEYIAMVIAHETSHQWFGNLVTMQWWDDLWLNESFANMMEFQAVDQLFPDWHIWETFVMSEGLSALRRDATPGVQSVKTDVRHPDEINTLFDGSIVYAKGGRLLAMLKKFIGEEAFRAGLTTYFKKHAYGNTRGADLWAALSDVSGQDVGKFMNPWLEQSGFPLVTVQSDDVQVKFSQHHFLDDPAATDDRRWPVPLFSDNARAPQLLKKPATKAPAAGGATMANVGSHGHYIVQYADAPHLAAVIALAGKQQLTAPDRLMLLNNASMLAKAGNQPFVKALEILQAYDMEQSEPVWAMMSLVIAETRRFIDLDERLEARIKAFLPPLTARELARLGWDEKAGESVADNKLRGTIIGLNLYAEEPETLHRALALFEAYKAGTPVAPELRSLAMVAAIKAAVPGALAWLLEHHDQTANSDLKADVAAAATATRSVDDARMLLDRLTNAQLVKPQDADHWLIYLLRNRYVRDVSWQWMIDHWDWIERTYSHDKSYDHFPRSMAAICNTPEWAQKYDDLFLPKRDDIELGHNIAIGRNEIRARIAWLQRDLAGVQTFFGE